jgi:GTP1/Obg family GTP-binding protein
LFKNIKPLFQAKPLVIVLSKVDLCKYKDLNKEGKGLIEGLQKELNAFVI